MKKSVSCRAVCICAMMFAAACLAGCSSNKPTPQDNGGAVTIGTLLTEMTDRDAAARYPFPAYTSASFSSYDRTTTSKTDNWYGNGDSNWFTRVETVGDRTEYVLFDADGPGAITRWWMTFAGKGGSGIMRIYIDNAEEPALAANPYDLLSGNRIAHSPIAGSISQLTEVEHRGHNFFYPIPYSKHCKITYSSENIQPDGDKGHIKGDENNYYNIEYRTYTPGTEVESFSEENVAKYAEIEAAAAEALNNPGEIGEVKTKSLDCTLGGGDSFELKLKGPAAIREIAMQMEAEDMNQALRSTVLEISFDGESTVFIPVGEFFGVGYKPLYTNMWYVKATEEGAMTARWVMPFSSNAVVKITNCGDQQVSIRNAHASVSKWNFDERSMYFHAMWKLYPKLDTRTDPVTGATGSMYDINFVNLEGKGVYMGDSMTIFDKASGWWGEGDEKVYVDGAEFPSIFGTGSEDYYGYAWCHPNVIVDHPFTSQPSGSGNLTPGYTFNSRLRSLDRIGFAEKLVFDMEIWHWQHSNMDLGVSNYFYLLPGGTVKNERDTTGITAKPVVSLLEFVEFSEYLIDIETEYLTVDSISGGNYETQTVFGEHWSNGAQVYWGRVPAGSELVLSFDSPFQGVYNLKMLYAYSWDYGCFDIWFNSKQIESARDFYSKDIRTAWSDNYRVVVKKGHNTIRLKAVASHPGYNECFFGFDRFVLEKDR